MGARSKGIDMVILSYFLTTFLLFFFLPFFLFPYLYGKMLRIILFTIAIGILFYVAPEIGLSQYVHAQKWVILSFFFTISYLNHILMQIGFAKNRENFVQYYLGSVTGRLILSLIFIGTFVYLGTADINTFIIDFFVLYLCYTGFEIFGLYRNLRLFS